MHSQRQQRKREETIEEILGAARAIMREDGAAALSIQELARRMDMKAPSLYNYFSGKQEIYDTLFRQGFEQFDVLVQDRLQAAPSWRSALTSYIEAYMSFALANPELYQLCFERPVPGFVPSAQSLEVSFGALRRGYAIVASWRPEINSDLSDEQIGDLVIAVAHGLTALHLANQPDLPAGAGRFGGLISAAVSILAASWSESNAPQGGPS